MPMLPRRLARTLAVPVVCLLASAARVPDASAPHASGPPAARAADAPRVEANDNRTSAGVLRRGVLTVRLVARPGDWRPDGDSAAGAIVPAFGEEGAAPSIPGPMIRVTAGTVVRVSVRNALASETLIVHGLHDRTVANSAADSLVLAPGATRAVEMRLDAPGTYYYWATTMGRALEWRTREDAQLSGAIVVDPVGAKPGADRVMVIGMWSDTAGRVLVSRNRMLAVINGRSWPRTERLDYTVGDTIHWRVINASADTHPMHLHGFYFRVDSHGDGDRDTLYAASDRPLAVTDLLIVGATMSMTWVPDRPGNWLFHCHLPDHFEARGPLGVGSRRSAMEATAHDGTMPAMNHATQGMGGLVMGVRVHPSALTEVARQPASPSAPRRRLRLEVRSRDGGTELAPTFRYALFDERDPTPFDSAQRGAPAIVLTRGEPVSVTVVNTLTVPTAVHWHGIELESYYDGVAGFSGSSAQTTPVIAAGDSFEARFTPPRAGTFIYHTHVDEQRQQPGGLAGALIVVEPGARFDAAHDLPIVISSSNGSFDAQNRMLVNGRATPEPLEMRAGVTYRLRFVNMTMRRPQARMELHRDSTIVQWRDLSRDGASLPATRQVWRPAKEGVTIGQTLDVEVRPTEPGAMQLQVRGGPFDHGGVVLTSIPVNVRATTP